ncbi:MAG: thiamine pyrophosphate-dependent enzyme [Planctomycetota bacterium]
MAISAKEAAKRPELLAPGHRACAGCTAPAVLRMALKVAGPETVVGFATGCMEVVTTIFPYTSWRVPYIHNAFENAAATVSGVETAYRALKKKGKVTKDIRFIAFGGDGGTYDIGFQSLSGAMERGHRMLYICYDNEAYMNTGIQRSSSTPRGADTNTSQAGKVKQGKGEYKKDLTAVMVAHNIPFVAQAVANDPRDFMGKVEAALAADGPSFINVLSPCNRGWRIPIEKSMEICDLAVDTCMWPVFEVVNGQWKISRKPKAKKPVTDYLFIQGRFAHLKKEENKGLVAEIQADVDRRWNELLKKCGEA